MATTYLTRTFGTPTSDKKFTLSLWLKRSNVTTDNSFFSTYTDVNNRADIRFNASEQLSFYEAIGGVTQYYVVTDRLFRDCSAYYNIVIAFDTTQAVDTNRLKLYVNGVQETSFSSTSFPALNQSLRLTSAVAHSIGNDSNSAYYFDGLMTHVQLVDGLSLAPTEFGEVDATSGIWKIKTGCYATPGTNGFCLKMETTTGSAMGTDSSGEGNNFTENGSPTQAIDTPSNVMATWNAIDNYYPNYNFSDGNTTATHPTQTNYFAPVTATMGVSTGKWYWENKFVSTTQASHKWIGVGVTATTATASNVYFGTSDYDLCYYGLNDVYRNNAKIADLSAWTVGDIIGVALDATNDLVYFYKNGVVENSGTGFSLASVGSSPNGVYKPGVGVYDNAEYVCSTNFGNGFFGTTQVSSAGTSSTDDDSIWEYDCPTGYYGLNTKNINTYG